MLNPRSNRTKRCLMVVFSLIFPCTVLLLPGTTFAKKSVPWGHPEAWDVPAKGAGTFEVASGGSPIVGQGSRYTYKVEVENGIDESADRFAQLVEEFLFDPRGWAGSDSYSLRRVDTGTADFRVTLASPETVDEFCKPLDTKGVYSCWNGNRAMINLWRWYGGHPIFQSLSNYRAHVINHEVGHALGHGHENRCPTDGQAAPVMMQQTINLKGCSPNAWVNPNKKRENLKRAYARVKSETLYYRQIAKNPAGEMRKTPEQTLAGGEGRVRSVDVKQLYQIVFRFLYYDYLDKHDLYVSDTEVTQLARTLETQTYWLSDQGNLEDFLPAYIRSWKFRQRLYSQYRGKVRQDLFGFVPVEAYRAFLRSRQSSGTFEIYVPSVSDRFWSINPQTALFLSTPVRRESIGQAVNEPPWMTRSSRR